MQLKNVGPFGGRTREQEGKRKRKGNERIGRERKKRKGEGRGIQVILLLEEMDSFIINPLGLISAQRWL